jgi:putative thioredoxin
MSMPPIPKGFGNAFDLSTLKKPAADTTNMPGISINQTILVKEILPSSNKKVFLVVCWSPRSAQSIELIQTLGKFQESDKGELPEAPWELAHVNVDTEAAVAQAFQVQSVPFAVGIIAEQPVPLFESVPPNDQIRLVINKVLELAAQKGIGSAVEVGETETPVEPEEAAAMEAMEKGDLVSAEKSFKEWVNRQPGNQMAKLGLSQVQLLIRIKNLDPEAVLAKAASSPNDVEIQRQAADVEIANGRNKEAFERLIHAVKIFVGDDQKSAREHLLVLFGLVDPSDPDLIKARQSLASALF